MNFALVYPGERTRFAITATLAILFWVALIVGTLGIALIYLLLFFVVYLFAQSAFIAYLRGSAVKISPEQFPDLDMRLHDCATKIGLKNVPDAYLLHADGLFNALATKFLGRNYIVLYSSVVDALATRPEALNFYIGHELGHIHRKHLSWGPVLAPMAWLPLLGAALRRAEEYTCDRYGLYCCESADDAKAGMAALAAGHSRWSGLNYLAFQGQRTELTGFWSSFHEFTSDYPWLAKRAFAIQQLAVGREPDQFGRSFFAGFLALFVPRVPGAGGAGFLVVVAMIGVLAAIAIPAYQDYVRRAEIVGLMSQTGPAKAGVEQYAISNNQWPASLKDIGLESGELAAGKLSAELELGEHGRLQYHLRGGSLSEGSLVLVPQPQFEGEKLIGLDWKCAGEGLPEKILPIACRQ
ncbi:MAG: hypothetical protein EPN60_00730 [Nevskiaceae bacterium]|nr:MAG: hypothetical protein EPO48_06185 [Nevskiaceae bacterium]TAM33717.1 MAG: hypothetical protein EPN60_00730 [Nevskiaceae bacterium]